MSEKLFAVYLGGRAPKCNTELHDVVFAVGESIEATYEQLMDKWFGTAEGLHLDSWLELDIIDGHKISLVAQKMESGKKLYFVNLGAYMEGQFTEIHANTFIVAENAQEAKKRGKAELLKDWPSNVHTDDIHEIDDCLELSEIGSRHIVLHETGDKAEFKPVNGYHIIPKTIIAEYMARKRQASGSL